MGCRQLQEKHQASTYTSDQHQLYDLLLNLQHTDRTQCLCKGPAAFPPIHTAPPFIMPYTNARHQHRSQQVSVIVSPSSFSGSWMQLRTRFWRKCAWQESGRRYTPKISVVEDMMSDTRLQLAPNSKTMADRRASSA